MTPTKKLLTWRVFQEGLAWLVSCNGPNLDQKTAEVWFEMLQHITDADFVWAVKDLIGNEEKLPTVNFVYQIKKRARYSADLRLRCRRINDLRRQLMEVRPSPEEAKKNIEAIKRRLVIKSVPPDNGGEA